MARLAPRRAPAHRDFIGPAFGVEDEGGEDPQGLTPFDVMADPRLAPLGREVFDQLRAQFAADAAGETDEEERYRLRLESWADALEVLLEEVLDELASLRGAAGGAPGRGDAEPGLA